MKKYFLFDDEKISGKTYVLRLFVSVLLLVFLVGIWLVASTAYKRARSLGWDEGNSNVISFLIIIHLSIPIWPNSLFESGSGIFFVQIPLLILQLYMISKNGKKRVKDLKARKVGKAFGNSLMNGFQYCIQNKEKVYFKTLRENKEAILETVFTSDLVYFPHFPCVNVS